METGRTIPCYPLVNVSGSFRPDSFSAVMLWLTQVASLASRHVQDTVHAAFFCLFPGEVSC